MVSQTVCNTCFDTITDKVCEKCLFKQVNYWLADLPISGLDKKKMLLKLKTGIYSELPLANIDNCTLCQQEGPSICGYCFFYQAARTLKKLNIARPHLASFLQVFNYRAFREAYVL